MSLHYHQNPSIGVWISVFKPNAQNITTFMLSKALQRFQPNLAQRYRPPISLRGLSQYAPDKSKMADGRHFEKKPLNRHNYLCERLTDFDKIWHDDANWSPIGNKSIKFKNFQKPRWRQPTSWKSQKSRYHSNRSKTAKIIKRWYYSASRWLSSGLMVGNITF